MVMCFHPGRTARQTESLRIPLTDDQSRLNDDGSIAVDQYFETCRTGIFAAGDVHGEIRLIPVAWAEGIQAAIYAFDEITRPYWLNENRLRSSGPQLCFLRIRRRYVQSESTTSICEFPSRRRYLAPASKDKPSLSS